MTRTPTTIRLSRGERVLVDEFMRDYHMTKLGSSLRKLIRYGILTSRLLNKGKFEYAMPPIETIPETLITHLTPESKKKFLELLIEEVGPEYVKRLREMNPTPQSVVDKDIREEK